MRCLHSFSVVCLLLVVSPACTLDFDRFGKQLAPQHDASIDAAVSGSDSSVPSDASMSSDASTMPDAPAPEPICTADDQRCHGSNAEVCSKDGTKWQLDEACGDKFCSPATLACNACKAPVSKTGVLSCASARAKSTGAAIASGDTKSGADDEHGSCGGSGSPERVVEWNVPETDYWVLDTHGSDYDTVMYARDCSCDGDELACNNNADSSTADSEIVARFERGQRVAVFLDGSAGDKGKAVLNAQQVSCPTFDLDVGSLPSTFVDRGKDHTEAFRFTPDVKAFYSIRANAKPGVKVCLQQGPRCGGPELACNTGDNDYGAQVLRQLPAGKPVTIIVTLAATDTSFDLDITKVAGATCATSDIFDHLGSSMAFAAPGNALSASCMPAGYSYPSVVSYDDMQFVLHNPIGVSTQYTVIIESQFAVAAYLLDGDCSGAEVACSIGTYDSTSMKYTTYLVVNGDGSARDSVVVIENIDRTPGGPPGTGFEINISIAQ